MSDYMGMLRNNSVAKIAPNMVMVHRRGTVQKTRKLVQYGGIGPGFNFYVHNSEIYTLARAIAERMLLVFDKEEDTWLVREPPEEGFFFKRMSKFSHALRNRLPFTPRMGTDKFLSHYAGRQLTILTTASLLFEQRGLKYTDGLTRAFVKDEMADKVGPARAIQPRSPVYHFALGRYIKPLEGVIYACIAGIFGEVTVSKGLNAVQTANLLVGKFRTHKNCAVIGLDASKFDGSIHKWALKWEQQIFVHPFKGSDRHELSNLLRAQLLNRGTGHCYNGKLRYEVEGGRMSGDMNTGLGNCLIMCGLVHSYMKQHNIKYSLLNNGDDCVLFMERKHVNKLSSLPRWFQEMGFSMKVEPAVYKLEEVEFCKSRPIETEFGHVMVRNFPRAIDKDLMTTKSIKSLKDFDRMRASIAHCGLALAGSMPVYGAFYRYLLRGAVYKHLDRDQSMSGMKYMARGLHLDGPVHWKSRVSFWEAFGIQPNEQVALENHYDKSELKWRNPLPIDNLEASQIIRKHYTR